jgi:hypothetical protein
MPGPEFDLVLMFWLRVACLVLWAVVAAITAPVAVRVIRGRYTDEDEHQSFKFFTALLFIGSLGRWLIFPDNQGLFLGLYLLTATLAIYALVLIRQYWRH